MLAGLVSPENSQGLSSMYIHFHRPCVYIFSFYKDSSQIRPGPILMASFWLNYFIKGPTFKCSQMLRYKWVGLQHINCEGHISTDNTNRVGVKLHPITILNYIFLKSSDAENLSVYLLAICMSFEKCLFVSFAHSLN